MSHELSLKEVQKLWHGSFKSYYIGFFGSLALTTISFLLVLYPSFSKPALLITLIASSVLQAMLQLLFFLHLGHEEKPRWSLMAFYFMIIILLIVLIGSLWIMNDLHMRMMEHD